MLEEIEELFETALDEISSAPDPEALEGMRVRYLGRKSRLREIMSQIGSLPSAQRPALGQTSGATQKAIQQALEQRQVALQEAAEVSSGVDVTLPGRRPLAGSLHPLMRLTEELVAIFQGMGFS